MGNSQLGNIKMEDKLLLSEKLKNLEKQKGIKKKKRYLKIGTTYKKLKEIKEVKSVPNPEKFLNIKPRLKKKTNHQILFSKTEDRRIKVKDTKKFPFSAMGLLKMKFGDKTYNGTGVMIYPMIVLTVAHNIYEIEDKEEATNIEYFPSGKESELGGYKVIDYFFCEDYKIDQDEDYAILILEKGDKEFSLGLYTGFFGLKIIKDFHDIENKKISIHGFPKDKNCEMVGMDYLVKNNDNTRIEENGIICHDLDTNFGQSGSGIILQENDNHYIIGIHSSGGNKHNYGVLITEKRFSVIKNWIYKYLLKNLKLYKDEEILNYTEIELELKELNLKGLNLGKEVLKNLSEKYFQTLIKLNLSNNQLGNSELSNLKNLENLESLNLSSNSIEKKGLDILAEIDLSNLKYLSLANNKISYKGVKKFLNKKKFDKLERLDLRDTWIDEDCAKNFAQEFNFDNSVILYSTNLDEKINEFLLE